MVLVTAAPPQQRSTRSRAHRNRAAFIGILLSAAGTLSRQPASQQHASAARQQVTATSGSTTTLIVTRHRRSRYRSGSCASLGGRHFRTAHGATSDLEPAHSRTYGQEPPPPWNTPAAPPTPQQWNQHGLRPRVRWGQPQPTGWGRPPHGVRAPARASRWSSGRRAAALRCSSWLWLRGRDRCLPTRACPRKSAIAGEVDLASSASAVSGVDRAGHRVHPRRSRRILRLGAPRAWGARSRLRCRDGRRLGRHLRCTTSRSGIVEQPRDRAPGRSSRGSGSSRC